MSKTWCVSSITRLVRNRLPGAVTSPDAGLRARGQAPAASDQYIDFAADAQTRLYSVYIDGELYIVRMSDVYTAVYEHTGIAGGWAAEYPAGGIVAAPTPNYEDSTGYYIRWCW